jgi:hypothetical protein
MADQLSMRRGKSRQIPQSSDPDVGTSFRHFRTRRFKPGGAFIYNNCRRRQEAKARSVRHAMGAQRLIRASEPGNWRCRLKG